MKRSEVNAALLEAREMLQSCGWTLPTWADWNLHDYEQQPDIAHYLRQHQMGWDVTDFGSGNFPARGLTLFCLRNGVQSDTASKPYAEKLLFIGENQETPFHRHQVKMEDIINRGGGILTVEFCHADADDKTPIEVAVDGIPNICNPHEPLRLQRGQSVTMTRGLYHRFYAEAGSGMVLGGEVSQVNDDETDNYFLDPVGRFSAIEEDEIAATLLWNEIPVTGLTN